MWEINTKLSDLTAGIRTHGIIDNEFCMRSPGRETQYSPWTKRCIFHLLLRPDNPELGKLAGVEHAAWPFEMSKFTHYIQPLRTCERVA